MKLTFNCFFIIQTGNYYFQLASHIIWFCQFTVFSTELKKYKYIWNKIKTTMFADIDFLMFLVLFSEKITFYWRRYWYRWHWKLRVFTKTSGHQWGILKQLLIVDSLLEILTKRRSQMLYRLVDVQSSISIWNFVNQLGMIFFLWVSSK